MARANLVDDGKVQTDITWEDRRWWSGALHKNSAIDYFAQSPFYDRTCLNEHLRMQRTTLQPEEAADMLARLPGIVYALDENRTEEIPPTADTQAHMLYVIRKFRRDISGSKKSEVTLRFYYILDGVVYEAPSLESVMQTRLLKMAWHLHEAWKLAAEREPRAAAGSHTQPRASQSTSEAPIGSDRVASLAESAQG